MRTGKGTGTGTEEEAAKSRRADWVAATVHPSRPRLRFAAEFSVVVVVMRFLLLLRGASRLLGCLLLESLALVGLVQRRLVLGCGERLVHGVATPALHQWRRTTGGDAAAATAATAAAAGAGAAGGRLCLCHCLRLRVDADVSAGQVRLRLGARLERHGVDEEVEEEGTRRGGGVVAGIVHARVVLGIGEQKNKSNK